MMVYSSTYYSVSLNKVKVIPNLLHSALFLDLAPRPYVTALLSPLLRHLSHASALFTALSHSLFQSFPRPSIARLFRLYDSLPTEEKDLLSNG